MVSPRIPISGQASLFSRSIAIVMLSTLFAAFTISLTAYQVLTRDILAQSSEALSRNSAYHAEMIHRDLMQRKYQLDQFAETLVDERGRLLPVDVLTERLRILPRLGGLFSEGLVVMDANGKAIAESIPVPGRVGTTYGDRPHIRAILDDPKLAMAGPIIGRTTGLPLLSFMAPIRSPEGELLGLMTAILDLTDDDFYALTANPLPLKASQRLYILDLDNGYAIRHPDLAGGIQPLPDPELDPVVRHVVAQREDGVVDLGAAGDALVTQARLEVLGWTLVSVASFEEIAQPAVSGLVRFALVSLAILAVVVVLAVWLVYRNLKPLNDSTRAIEHLVHHPGDHRFLPVSKLVEIRRLNAAFNLLMEEQRRYQEELEHEKDRFVSLFSQSTNALILLRPEDWTIERINETGRQVLGLEPDDAQGRALEDCIHVSPDALATVKRRIDEGDAVKGATWTLYEEEAEPRVYEISAASVTSGYSRSILLTLRDITESRQLQNAKDEFISTVSHELRTPLTSLSGSLKLLQSDVIAEMPREAIPVMNIALKNSERLQTLVNDLLDVNRLMTGRMSFHLDWHSVTDLVNEAVDSNQALAAVKGIDLIRETPRVDREIHVDPVRYRQILDNLISNAIKFSPDRSQIRIVLRHDAGNSRVEVIDQGPGIPEAFRSRIFQRFSQADASARRAQEGTGLGLAISRELTEQMEGRIDFERGRFVGACFHVDFASRPVSMADGTDEDDAGHENDSTKRYGS
ncbi:sensor histidine kinase [Saccharospirillum salsuginis]|uniref:histidine kinase n=1 Tax=Saccharospirillum salsuginis TaxID=418750 RepID=A0A918KSV5_9GAMM|nr:ATP-binding protein [Saccharospirillum salsuginis]GGX75881.1 hypothetical protein GCM10007392_48610 [Saccharospirillum salsuginis]